MEYNFRFEAIKAIPATMDKNVCAFICNYTLNGVTVDKLNLWIDLSCKDEDVDYEFINNHIEEIKEEVTNPINHEFIIYTKPTKYDNDYLFYYWSHYFDATIELEEKTITLSKNNNSSSWYFYDLVESFYRRIDIFSRENQLTTK